MNKAFFLLLFMTGLIDASCYKKKYILFQFTYGFRTNHVKLSYGSQLICDTTLTTDESIMQAGVFHSIRKNGQEIQLTIDSLTANFLVPNNELPVVVIGLDYNRVVFKNTEKHKQPRY